MPLTDFLQRLCERPKSLAPSGSFDEIALFLEGYDCATREFAPEEVKAISLREFGRWLSYSHENADIVWLIDGDEVPHNLAWWAKVQRLYPDDTQALQALPVLYQQFLDDPRRAVWQDYSENV